MPCSAADELLGAAIALVVLEPGLADGAELALEPAADDVDRDAAVGEMVDRGDLLGGERRVPRSGQERGDHLEPLGGGQQRVAEGDRLVLELGAVAGGEADLAQRVVEAAVLGDLRELAVVVDAPSSVRCSILLMTRPPLTFGTQ